MADLSKDEIRQRVTEYFKALEEGQEYEDILFEDQLLLAIVQQALMYRNISHTDWFLPFSDIEKIRQVFYQYYLFKQFGIPFEKMINALKGSGVVRKRQFLELICKEMQIIKTPSGYSIDLEDNQTLKKEIDKLIKNKKPISGEFIFKLYQEKYIHLKAPSDPGEIDVHLMKNFSDSDESCIFQLLQSKNFVSTIRLILLKDFEVTQQIKEGITNNRSINDQSYYDYLHNLPELKKRELFNKLYNEDQYFIDIITRIISKRGLNHIFSIYEDETYLVYVIQLALQQESKDFIAFYMQSYPNNTINFLKECNFIPSTDKEFERNLEDQKLLLGEFILKVYEQKFFMDPLRKIAREKNIPFDEKGFYQIRKEKEQKAFKSICDRPIYALDIAFLLAEGITLSNREYGYKLKKLCLQAEEFLSQLISFIERILGITKDYYPQFNRRQQAIIERADQLLNDFNKERQIEKQQRQQEEKKEKMQEEKESKGILIKTVRIKGFRGLKNIEVDLEKTTVLTGANNTGKSSILYALQLAFGNYQFVSQDDFFIEENSTSKQIIIDVLIVPIDDKGEICNNFTDDWISLFTADRIKPDPNDLKKNQVPFRTKIEFSPITNSFKKQQFSISGWPKFKENDTNWSDKNDGDENTFYFDEIPFFYIDAQRDILKDIKLKNSYLGKMISKIEYSEKDIKAIEEQIKSLNDKVVGSSVILSHIKTVLGEINSTMGTTDNASIEIAPFTKKVRDLNKGLSIYYADQKDSFSMEYHGMGTRSWSSLLTLKTFISSRTKKNQEQNNVFFPILAVEEPEAHLHPNAQKRLYHQINSIEGQKIISTHSPYVAAKAKIEQIRGLYKKDRVTCGKVTGLSLEDKSKIKTHVIHTHGEIIFSKFIVFSEGQTESQALPIFAEKFFQKHPSDMGLNFVEVRGKGYSPFVQFAKSLNIPWIVFSDADQRTKQEVTSQLSRTEIDSTNLDKFVVFLDDGENFESQLIKDEFETEVKKAYLSIQSFNNENHQNITRKKIETYNNEELIELMKTDKIRMGEAVAKEIIKGKKLPVRVKELFDKIKAHYNKKDENNVNRD